MRGRGEGERVRRRREERRDMEGARILGGSASGWGELEVGDGCTARCSQLEESSRSRKKRLNSIGSRLGIAVY